MRRIIQDKTEDDDDGADDKFSMGEADKHIARTLERDPFGFTEREHKLAEFCEAYSNVTFATISAGVSVLPELGIPAGDGSTPTTPHPMQLGVELKSLIDRGMLEHKIDAADPINSKLVHADQDAWSLIRSEALEAAAEIERDLLLRLHEVNVVLAGLEINDRAENVVGTGRKRTKGVS